MSRGANLVTAGTTVLGRVTARASPQTLVGDAAEPPATSNCLPVSFYLHCVQNATAKVNFCFQILEDEASAFIAARQLELKAIRPK
jgi:hypothetical protein